MERDDVRVAEPPDGLGLAREPQVRLALGIVPGAADQQELERDGQAEQRVRGLVDPPGRAAADEPLDLEPARRPGAGRRAPRRHPCRQLVGRVRCRIACGVVSSGWRGRPRGVLGRLQRGELLGRARDRGVVLPQAREHLARGAAKAERQQGAAQRAQGGGAERRGPHGDLQVPGRLLVAAEPSEQPPELEPRAGRLLGAAVGDQALADEARLPQLAGLGPDARLVERRAGLPVEARRARLVAPALGRARRLERTAARGERVGDRQQVGRRGGRRRRPPWPGGPGWRPGPAAPRAPSPRRSASGRASANRQTRS